MNNETLDLLETVGEAEASGLLPYQTNSKLADILRDSDLLEICELQVGADTVSGYSLTRHGREKCCEHFRETVRMWARKAREYARQANLHGRKFSVGNLANDARMKSQTCLMAAREYQSILLALSPA